MTDIRHIGEACRWNISRIAAAFKMDRGVVRRRLREAGVEPVDARQGINLYDLKEVGPALFAGHQRPAGSEPDGFFPSERLAWYQSELQRIKLEQSLGILVRVEEAHRAMADLAKSAAYTLDGLADMLERDAALPPEALEQVERVTDRVRESLYQSLVSDDENEPAA